VVNVTDRPNVHVRLAALEFLLGHCVTLALNQTFQLNQKIAFAKDRSG
jgi:hypothetical protein